MFEELKLPSALNILESYLAAWTGKNHWLSAPAKIESSLSVPAFDARSRSSTNASTFIILSYEVDGMVYTKAFRMVAGHQQIVDSKTNTSIRYKPFRPEIAYWPPACQLASRLLVGLVIGTAIAFIGVLAAH